VVEVEVSDEVNRFVTDQVLEGEVSKIDSEGGGFKGDIWVGIGVGSTSIGDNSGGLTSCRA